MVKAGISIKHCRHQSHGHYKNEEYEKATIMNLLPHKLSSGVGCRKIKKVKLACLL